MLKLGFEMGIINMQTIPLIFLYVIVFVLVFLIIPFFIWKVDKRIVESQQMQWNKRMQVHANIFAYIKYSKIMQCKKELGLIDL